MPNKDQLEAVGQTCSEFSSESSVEERSCAACQHWVGDQEMCNLDIFLSQLTSLDQT